MRCPTPTSLVVFEEQRVAVSNRFGRRIMLRPKVKARAGAAAKGGNRITLLRDADSDGVRNWGAVLVDHLRSPYGVLRGLRGPCTSPTPTRSSLLPFTPEQTKITGYRRKARRLARGSPINHHWTKASVPARIKIAALCWRRFRQQQHPPKTGWTSRKDGAAILQVDRLARCQASLRATGTRGPTSTRHHPARGRDSCS